MNGWADLSSDGRYRYALGRQWAEGGTTALFIGLNPSTADAKTDDPTIRRCIRFARDWGHTRLVMLNLFAWRATKPANLPAGIEAIGPRNDTTIRALIGGNAGGIVIAAWGAHPRALERVDDVRRLAGRLHVLGLTDGGQPRHPLYMRADTEPVPWS